MKKSLKTKAIELRKKGYSYAMIKEQINVSKSTLSHWLRDVPFNPNSELTKRIGKAKAKSSIYRNKLKQESISKAKKIASDDIGALSARDLHMLGIGLYMGEGAKLYEHVRIINSDIKIIKLSIKWFIDICKVELNNLSIALHVYPDTNIQKTINYWHRETKIPLNNFEKVQIDKRIKSGKKKNFLPYGTAHITIRSRGNKDFGVFLHRRIIGWIEHVNKKLLQD